MQQNYCEKNKHAYDYDREPTFPTIFYSVNAYKFIIDEIWINNIIFFLDIYDFSSLTQTCCDLNKLLTRNMIQNIYWKKKCEVLLNTSFMSRNNSDNSDNSGNSNGQSETFHQCFKPINNDWKQFYIEMKIILEFKKYKYATDIANLNSNCKHNDKSLESWICNHGSTVLVAACRHKEFDLQLAKFVLDMNVILVRRDIDQLQLKGVGENDVKNELSKLNKINFLRPAYVNVDVFDCAFKNKHDDYALLKLLLNHETMLYKDPHTQKYPINYKSYSIVTRLFDCCNPRLIQIFFNKKFNISIRCGIINPNDENHEYYVDGAGTGKGGILTLACAVWSGRASVECFKSLLSCTDMDLSKQINETLFFDLIGNQYYLHSATDDKLPKIFSFFLCKTWKNSENNYNCEDMKLKSSTNTTAADNKNRCDVINDEANINNSASEYKIRDIYETQLANIDIIHARDKNGDSLFYKCTEYCVVQLNTLKFLYEYAIEMNKQFPEKYSEYDVYYFVNNINPNILLNQNDDVDINNNKKEQVTRKTRKLQVISNVNFNKYSLIDFDQFSGEYYGKRHSTFMVACRHGYCTKIQFLIDYCQLIIDLSLCGWNRKAKQYCYASDLAIMNNEEYDEIESWGIRPRHTRVSEELIQWIKLVELGYHDYCMKISFQFLLYKLVINIYYVW